MYTMYNIQCIYRPMYIGQSFSFLILISSSVHFTQLRHPSVLKTRQPDPTGYISSLWWSIWSSGLSLGRICYVVRFPNLFKSGNQTRCYGLQGGAGLKPHTGGSFYWECHGGQSRNLFVVLMLSKSFLPPQWQTNLRCTAYEVVAEWLNLGHESQNVRQEI